MTNEELERALRLLLHAYDEIEIRGEALRVACETKGAFNEDDFQQALAMLRQRGHDARASLEVALGRQATEWLLSALRPAGTKPQ